MLLFSDTFYIVKGDSDDDHRCDEPFGCATVAAPIQETHAVRCCSDDYIEGWRRKYTCDVWAESDCTETGDCRELTWSEANNYCKEQSARLCTRTELEASCAEETGCSFDYRLVWSNTRASGTAGLNLSILYAYLKYFLCLSTPYSITYFLFLLCRKFRFGICNSWT